MKYLFDTSALLAHHRKEKGWEQVQEIFEDSEAVILIASVTLTEFSRRMSELGADHTEVTATLQSYRLTFSEVVAIDEPVAWRAFELTRQLPSRLPLVDSLIAAAAASRDATLVHRDKHMTAIPAKLAKTLVLV